MQRQMCFYMMCMLRCLGLFQFQQGLQQLNAAHVPNGNGTLYALYSCHMAMSFLGFFWGGGGGGGGSVGGGGFGAGWRSPSLTCNVI